MMYRHRNEYRTNDDDYILAEELLNLVALVNCRTNSIVWVTRHILSVEYILKTPEENA